MTDIAEMFSQFVIDAERNLSAYEFAASAMKRWYLALPRFAKETKGLNGEKVDPRYQKMVRLLKQNVSGQELLFEKLPEAFGYREFNGGLAENIQKAKEYYDNVTANLKQNLIEETKDIFAISTNRANLKRVSLSENGTDKCLGLFKAVTNDEGTFISRLVKVATDLRIEDWDDKTEKRFSTNLKMYRETAENFRAGEAANEAGGTSEYEIHFRSEDGSSEVKRFDRVEPSKRGKLLYNSILGEIDSMGYSISEQEKRQILMDILRKMC